MAAGELEGRSRTPAGMPPERALMAEQRMRAAMEAQQRAVMEAQQRAALERMVQSIMEAPPPPPRARRGISPRWWRPTDRLR